MDFFIIFRARSDFRVHYAPPPESVASPSLPDDPAIHRPRDQAGAAREGGQEHRGPLHQLREQIDV
jgi:hypothetical protein